MTMVEKLPGMADDALKNLHSNAVRLGDAGTAQQRASATALLPAIEAELTARKAAKQERLAEGRRARSKKTATAKAS